MKLFTKSKNEINIVDKAAAGITKMILKCQQWFASGLMGLTKSWKERQ